MTIKKCKLILSETNDKEAPIVLGVNLFTNIPGCFRGTKFHLHALGEESIIASTDKSLNVILLLDEMIDIYLSSANLGSPITEVEIEVNSEKEYWNKKEVEQLCWQAYITPFCFEDKIKSSVATALIPDFEEWFKENLK